MADSVLHSHAEPMGLEPLPVPRGVASLATPGTAILSLVSALIAVGVVMFFSTASQIEPSRNAPAWWATAAVRQTAFSIMALIVMLAVSRIDHRFWAGRAGSPFQPAVLLLIAALILLAAVLVPGIGVERNGARRWLNLGAGTGFLSFQPSELAKSALVLFLATFIARRGERIRNFFTGLVPALAVLGACVAIVGFEDFGTAALLGAVGGAMLWSSRASRRQLVLLAIPAALAMIALIRMKGYRQGRLTGFLHVWDDPGGKGYHQYQSLIAIASGGWRGQGLGAGIQKYGYLPEARSDFVFGVICEELGILGGAAVLALYVALIWQGGRAARRAPDEFGRLLALGGTLMIGIQAMINVGVVTVSFPTKGIALPFISAGGSGVLFLGFLAGLIAGVGRAPAHPRPSPDT